MTCSSLLSMRWLASTACACSPREMRDEAALQERNMQVALVAEELVASSRRADKLLPTWELAAMLIGRGVYD